MAKSLRKKKPTSVADSNKVLAHIEEKPMVGANIGEEKTDHENNGETDSNKKELAEEEQAEDYLAEEDLSNEDPAEQDLDARCADNAHCADNARLANEVGTEEVDDSGDEETPGSGRLEITGREVLRQVIESIGGRTRPAQEQMCNEVERAFLTQQTSLIQAGTGTGKSFAYLASALAYAKQYDQRVLISTATLALQRQLLSKDAPVVRKAWVKLSDQPIRVALLKGWSNYLCLAKIQAPDSVETLFDLGESTGHWGESEYSTDRGREIQRIRKWAKTTKTGDRDDLNPAVSAAAWQQASINPVECPKDECPLAADCFARQARRQAQEAEVVITNHSLLGLEAMTEASVLPEFGALIVDEAHELADRVRSQATLKLTVQNLERILTATRRRLNLPVENAFRQVQNLEKVLTEMSVGVLDELPKPLAENLNALLVELMSLLAQMPNPESNDPAKGPKRQIRLYLFEVLSTVERLLSYDPLWSALWLEENQKAQRILHTAPLSVAQPLAQRVYTGKGVVLTSATLKLGGEFTDLAGQVGANQPTVHRGQELDVGSSFDYRKQGIIYAPNHLPSPGRLGIDESYLKEMADLIAASGGGALGLFSSRRAVDQAAEYLADKLDFPLYIQGEDNLHSLIKRYREEPDACLLGTLTLWQGVDVPGLSSRLVVIDRIPFPRPNDPFISAREKAAKKRGENAFRQVYLSQAALLLAQGAGRLIRSATDQGVVAILDPRFRSANYARFLQATLPNFFPMGDRRKVLESLRRLAHKVKE